MKNLTVDILERCNLECEFCYQESGSAILTADDVGRIVDDNPDFGSIEIGGGEPFLHGNIVEIVRYIREQGRKAHVSTNATIIPKSLLELDDIIREDTQIQVSLHASNAELYKEITNKDMFDDVISNIERLKPAYSTLISSTVYQKNYDDVPNIVNLAGELGVPVRINLVFPSGKGADVDMLTQWQVDQLRGYLLGQKIMRKGNIESPLCHADNTGGVNCAALETHYGLQKKYECPVDCGAKKYISPKGMERICEFL